MDGSAELLQLAQLLRIGAATALKIAALRPEDAERIAALVAEAERMACDIDEMVGTKPAPERLV